MTFAARFIGWVKSLFQAQRSLRLRGSSNAYISRTYGTPTNRNTSSVAVCVKRGALGTVQTIFAAGTDDSDKTLVRFNAADQIEFFSVSASVGQGNLTTTAVFRDPTAWLWLFFVFDFSNATASERVRIFSEDTRLAVSTAVGVSGSNNHLINASTTAHRFARSFGTVQQGDMYDAAIHWVDGQALTPASFGERDISGNWRPKEYAGTYGANGFRLKFDDPTSLTTLTADSSGNGNNWTANNISLIAGVTYDSMLDVPLGGGGNERGNYATLNPARGPDHGTSPLSYANLRVGGLGSSNVNAGHSAGFAVSSGKWYFETTLTTLTQWAQAGIIDATRGFPFSGSSIFVGADATTFGIVESGSKITNNTPVAYGAAYSQGDVIGIAFDLDSGKLWFGKGGVWQGSGDPAAGTNAAFASIPAGYYYAAVSGSNGAVHDLNFGQRPFAYTPPAGFKALHTGNLPEPVIANPSKHFGAVTYTGSGGTQSVTGLQFQPDLVWLKCRSYAHSHLLVDSVRGKDGANYKALSSNLTNAEAGYPITSLDAGGFTITNSGGNANSANESGFTFVAWCFKAGGAAVANNNGSITSQVSANVEGGFSIVTYTGNSIAATVGHGLSAVPKMIITARRASGGAYWGVYHEANLATHALYLQTADAKQASAGFWNNTAPSSTEFSLGGSAQGNSAGVTYVAYCFAEVEGYSRIGTYNANGSADGPFVYCGFEPAFVLVKRTDSAGEWRMHDNARSPFNSVDKILRAEQTTAEGGSLSMDFTATGFKIRTTDANLNGGAAPYIFLAIAKTPMKYALAQ